MDNAKASYARSVQALATTLAGIAHQVEDVQKVWDNRLYGPGAANAFTDAELESLETAGGRKMTADDMYSFVILCAQLQAFLHNETPARSDYAATVNHIRTDI
jgi:hypothetical protein